MARRTRQRTYELGIVGQFFRPETEQGDVDQVRRLAQVAVTGHLGDAMRCNLKINANQRAGGCVLRLECTMNLPGCTARHREAARLMTEELTFQPEAQLELVDSIADDATDPGLLMLLDN